MSLIISLDKMPECLWREISEEAKICFKAVRELEQVLFSVENFFSKREHSMQ